MQTSEQPQLTHKQRQIRYQQHLHNQRTFIYEILPVFPNLGRSYDPEKSTEREFMFKLLQHVVCYFPQQCFEIANGTRAEFIFYPPFDLSKNSWKIT